MLSTLILLVQNVAGIIDDPGEPDIPIVDATEIATAPYETQIPPATVATTTTTVIPPNTTIVIGPPPRGFGR